MEVERNIEHIILNYKELLEFVQKAFPKCRQIDDYSILPGGAQNTNYQFRIGSDIFVLRLYVRGRSYCNVEKEIHLLIDSQVPTPKLIYADTEKNPPFGIFQFIKGIHISEVDQQQKSPLSYQLGKVLGFIHAFKFCQAGLFGEGIKIAKPFKAGSSPYFQHAFLLLSKGKFAPNRLGVNLCDQILTFIKKNKDFFPIVGEDISLVHADFKPGNLLLHEGKVYVLDWEFAHAGLPILDFAVLLRHRDRFPFDSESLVRGYTDSGHILPKDWFKRALITDFLNIVSMLEEFAERPKLFEQLKSAAIHTMEQWDSMNDTGQLL